MRKVGQTAPYLQVGRKEGPANTTVEHQKVLVSCCPDFRPDHPTCVTLATSESVPAHDEDGSAFDACEGRAHQLRKANGEVRTKRSPAVHTKNAELSAQCACYEARTRMEPS